jgi:hypothetical protein
MKNLLGKIKSLAIAGTQRWSDHDAKETWNPGDISALLAPLDDVKVKIIADVEDHVLQQVKDAVFEHAKDGVWCMGVTKEGKLIVALDIGNEVAPLLIKVGLLDLMNGTMKEAYSNIANPASQDVVAALQAFVRQLASLNLDARPKGQPLGVQTPARVATSQMGGKKVPVISRNMPPDPREAVQ